MIRVNVCLFASLLFACAVIPMLAQQSTTAGPAVKPVSACTSITSDGTAAVNALARFTTHCNVEGSAISDANGKVGIGGTPSTAYKLYVADSETNFGVKWLQNNIFTTSVTTNGTNDGLALDVNTSNMTIPAGVTDSGYRLAIRGLSYAYSTNFAGTLAAQIGLQGSAGIVQAKSGANVGAAYGGQFNIYNRVAGTTINNAYGVYIYNADTGGTILNRYDLYAASANANNYFAGKVGVGTTAPSSMLTVSSPIAGLGPISQSITIGNPSGNTALFMGKDSSNFLEIAWLDPSFARIKSGGGQPLALQDSGGSVGIGTDSPDNLLTVNGTADKPGGGSWGTFSDRRLKTLNGNFNSGLNQILRLNPVRYRYKQENALGIRDSEEHIGLVAQDVQRVIPEAVTENSKGYLLINNDPILWSMLNAIKQQQTIIKKQQQRIKAQEATLARLTSQVTTIQASLKASGAANPEVRPTNTRISLIHQ